MTIERYIEKYRKLSTNDRCCNKYEAMQIAECMKNDAVVVLDSGFGTHKGESDLVYRNRKMYAELAINALEKQIPKKPKEYEDKFYACPRCNNVLLHKWLKYPTELMPKENGLPYCLGCGQKIDWEEDEKQAVD